VATPSRQRPLRRRPAKTATCPHCGLVLRITLDKIGTRVRFTVKEWRGLCKFPHLDSPVLCLSAKVAQ
jgi:hypothetical protein